MYLSEFTRSGKIKYRGPDIQLPIEISIDSRTLNEGQIFLALKGDNTDGHLYIKEAVDKGAIGIIAQDGCFDLSLIPSSLSCIIVDDTSTFITQLALHYLEYAAPEEIIAITGSVGKTTTRELIRELLKLKYRVHGPISSFNTRLGCSLTVLAMPCNSQMLILEMGTNSPGEIEEMTSLFRPTVTVITEVTEAHLLGLINLEGVLKAKLEITSSPRLTHLFYNADNKELRKGVQNLSLSCKTTSIGFRTGDIRIEQPKFSLDTGKPRLSFFLEGYNLSLQIVSGLFGTHQARCLAVASAVALEMGVPTHMIVSKASSFVSQKGRGEVVLLSGNIVIIDDSYNANPASMSAAISTVSGLTWDGRKIAVLGSMKELGDAVVMQHVKIAANLDFFDEVILVGSEWEFLSEKEENGNRKSFLLMKDSKEALSYLCNNLEDGDMILVKGSHSNNLDLVVKELVKTR